MGTAICIQCGERKKSAFRACPACNFSPRGNPRAMAQSLLLSDRYYDSEKDHRPSKTELAEASRIIMSGGCIDWDEPTIARLIQEQETWDREEDVGWLRVIVLLLILLSIPLLALAVFLLRRIM